MTDSNRIDRDDGVPYGSTGVYLDFYQGHAAQTLNFAEMSLASHSTNREDEDAQEHCSLRREPNPLPDLPRTLKATSQGFVVDSEFGNARW